MDSSVGVASHRPADSDGIIDAMSVNRSGWWCALVAEPDGSIHIETRATQWLALNLSWPSNRPTVNWIFKSYKIRNEHTHTHTQNSSDNLLRCFRAGGADDTGVGDSVACWSMPCGRWTASPLPRFPASPFPRLTAGRLGPVTPRFRPSSKRVSTGLRRGFRRGSGGGSDGGSDGGCDPVIRGYRRVQAGSGGGWNWQWPPRVTPMQ